MKCQCRGSRREESVSGLVVCGGQVGIYRAANILTNPLAIRGNNKWGWRGLILMRHGSVRSVTFRSGR